MKLEKYKRVRNAIVVAIATFMSLGVVLNSIFIALVAVTFGIVTLSLLRRGLTEIEYDERAVLIRSKAASTTLAIATVAMAFTGLSLVFLSGQGIGNYDRIGHLLAFQALIILALRAALDYYYQNKLGG